MFYFAVTRIRTWVTAATTQGPNHQTITAIQVELQNYKSKKVILLFYLVKMEGNVREGRVFHAEATASQKCTSIEKQENWTQPPTDFDLSRRFFHFHSFVTWLLKTAKKKRNEGKNAFPVFTAY